MNKGYDRRTFLKGSLIASTGLGLTTSGGILANIVDRTTKLSTKSIPKRPLGKTGHQVTIYGLGGLFTTSMHDKHEQAVEIANRAIDLGVNYIDTSALYGNGASELNIGTVMSKRRDEVFLASKSHDYTYDGTMALVEQSLRRLQTDYLDLYQHHFLGRLGQLEQLQQKHSDRQAFERLREEEMAEIRAVAMSQSKIN
jgi:aryl-alcohol dehydrogenase-like predicted oxidoreductase